jgi:hypothetical protein
VSLDWKLLSQGAQAAKDEDLLSLVSRCRRDLASDALGQRHAQGTVATSLDQLAFRLTLEQDWKRLPTRRHFARNVA